MLKIRVKAGRKGEDGGVATGDRFLEAGGEQVRRELGKGAEPCTRGGMHGGPAKAKQVAESARDTGVKAGGCLLYDMRGCDSAEEGHPWQAPELQECEAEFRVHVTMLKAPEEVLIFDNFGTAEGLAGWVGADGGPQ